MPVSYPLKILLATSLLLMPIAGFAQSGGGGGGGSAGGRAAALPAVQPGPQPGELPPPPRRDHRARALPPSMA